MSVKRRIGLNTEGAEFTETEPEPTFEELRGSLPPYVSVKLGVDLKPKIGSNYQET